MSSQLPASNDRLRTYWTPTMERYFIDLMLEQMRIGNNRTGHTFNKQAWTDMLSDFNEKFRSRYDKDVLKSRYTNLWKQFNDIKSLLGQDGFSWDETLQKVVADDYVWDNYIKAHPDARPYKTKVVLNFSDLCLIYGYTSADGRYSRSSHDIDIDEDDVQRVNMGDGTIERSRTDWTIDMDQYFIELMLNQHEKGNKLDNTYSKQAWNDMLTSFNAKFGPQHTKRVLRHRYKKLCKYYNDIAVLLKQNGFSWDDKGKTVAAKDDVWDTYIKAHPNSRSYRTKSLPNYKHLVLIFGSEISTQSLNLDKDLQDVVVKSGASSAERSRTYWTPPMDRYLIDLLLEQVNNGNRIGQTFVAQAWIEMLASFNAKFRSRHDKDVLKNRYKHLKRQHHDIKILLEQRGFSWDETREMVVAEDHIWDAYIEVHPDARSYRVKTVPSYDKLCIIYSQDSSERIYSRLARIVAPSSERLCISIGEKEDDQLTANTGPNSNWTPQMDDCFIKLMLEQQVESVNTADDLGWAGILTSLNENCGQKHDICAIQNRYTYLMEQYNDVKRLLAQNGFSWDDTQQMVVADDHVWEAYTKAEPQAISYRGRILGHFKSFSRIFEKTILDNDVSYQRTPGISFGPTPLRGIDIVEAQNDDHAQTRETEASCERRKHTSETTLAELHERCSKVQKTEDDGMQEAFTEMANVVSKLVKRTVDTSYNAIERAVEALQAIPDMDDELLLDACDLMEDEKKAMTFLTLDVSLRKKWLLRKLGRC